MASTLQICFLRPWTGEIKFGLDCRHLLDYRDACLPHLQDCLPLLLDSTTRIYISGWGRQASLQTSKCIQFSTSRHLAFLELWNIAAVVLNSYCHNYWKKYWHLHISDMQWWFLCIWEASSQAVKWVWCSWTVVAYFLSLTWGVHMAEIAVMVKSRNCNYSISVLGVIHMY